MKFNCETQYLGKPCIHDGHEYLRTGKSLRYKRGGFCVCCYPDQLEAIVLYWKKFQQLLLDTEYLGTLCPKGHDWKKTGYSLRRKTDAFCVVCFSLKEAERELELQKQEAQKLERERELERRKIQELEQQQHEELQITLAAIHPILNLKTQHLGKLCPHNHDFEATGMSRRYNRNGGCVVCRRLQEREREKKLGRQHDKGDVQAQWKRRRERQKQKSYSKAIAL